MKGVAEIFAAAVLFLVLAVVVGLMLSRSATLV
jgi:hypothetical protein